VRYVAAYGVFLGFLVSRGWPTDRDQRVVTTVMVTMGAVGLVIGAIFLATFATSYRKKGGYLSRWKKYRGASLKIVRS
jgi:hypothetical protein